MLRLGSLCVMTALAACGSSAGPGEDAPVDGLLTVQWTGAHQGSFSGPAIGRWCPTDTLIEIVVARADTGVALAILGADSVPTGQYPVYSPQVFTTWRPQASAVTRWLGQNEVLGFEGTGGSLVLTETGDRLTGRIEASLKNSQETSTDTLHLTGEFTRIPVQAATPPCGRALKPAGA